MAKTKRKSKKLNKTRRRRGGTPKKDAIVPPPPSSLSIQYKRDTPISASTLSISKHIKIFNDTISIQKGDKHAQEKIFFGDFISTDITVRFNLYETLLNECHTLNQNNAINIIKKSIPGFDTTNKYPNILCSVALMLGKITAHHTNIGIYGKGGFAIQNALSPKKSLKLLNISDESTYKSGDIDFFMKFYIIPNEQNESDYIINQVNIIGAYLQSISNACMVDKNTRVVVRNIIRYDINGEPDSSCVLKISVQDTQTGIVTALVDVSYIPSIATDMLYKDALERTISNGNNNDIYTPIFYFPNIKQLALERLSYIDKFTSDNNNNKNPTDNPFKCSIVRSMNAFLNPIVLRTINDSPIEIDSIDILINLYIDFIVMEDESKQNELRERIRGFMKEYSEKECKELKQPYKSKSKTPVHR